MINKVSSKDMKLPIYQQVAKYCNETEKIYAVVDESGQVINTIVCNDDQELNKLKLKLGWSECVRCDGVPYNRPQIGDEYNKQTKTFNCKSIEREIKIENNELKEVRCLRTGSLLDKETFEEIPNTKDESKILEKYRDKQK